MKRGLLCAAAAVVLLVFGAWGLVSLRIYPAENVVEKDHVLFYLPLPPPTSGTAPAMLLTTPSPTRCRAQGSPPSAVSPAR